MFPAVIFARCIHRSKFKTAITSGGLSIANVERPPAAYSSVWIINLPMALVRDFWAFGEQYDGKYFTVDLDLSPLAGQDVKFVLSVLSLGDSCW